MASELRVNTLKDAAGNNSIATSFVAGGSAKMQASTNAAAASRTGALNVSSISDTATGKVTFNLSSAMSDGDYNIVAGVQHSSASGTGAYFVQCVYDDSTASATQVWVYQNGSLADPSFYGVANFGDLA
jgi:hypothetical protein